MAVTRRYFDRSPGFEGDAGEITRITNNITTTIISSTVTAASQVDVAYADKSVEEVLEELSLSVTDSVSRSGGGGRTIQPHIGVSGSVVLDLGQGSVQRIDGSTAVHSLTIVNASPGEVDFRLYSNATHAPTWPTNISAASDLSTIVWDGKLHQFNVSSIDGGTSWMVRLVASYDPPVAPDPLDPPPTLNVVWSVLNDRSAPITLASDVLDGTVHVWVNNNQAERLVFFMDTALSDAAIQAVVATNDNSADPGFVRGDSTVPFDLRGGTTSANPWDTMTDPSGNGRESFAEDGAHTLKVGARWPTGVYSADTSVASVAFTIDNSVGAVQFPQVPAGLAQGTSPDFGLVLNWTDTADGVGGFDDTVSYEMRYGLANPPSTAVAQAAPTNTFTISSGLTPATMYVQVRGVDADGDRSNWSSVLTATVSGSPTAPEAVTSWFQFYPAGDGVTAQPNSLLGGFGKGNPPVLENANNATADLQYPQSGGWSSPVKNNTNLRNSVANHISGSPSSVVERHATHLADSRIRKVQLPQNGGFGSEIGDGLYGAKGSVNFVISQRKHNAKTWTKPAGQDWRKVYISSTGAGGYTPGLPLSGADRTTNAEDSAVAYALLLSGALDAKLAALAVELVDNTSGGRPMGEWAQRIFMRLGWEWTAPWSSDYCGINPNLVGSNVLQNASTGGYGLGLTAEARSLLGALNDPGDPWYSVFTPNTALDGIPGHRQRRFDHAGVDTDEGTGGDLSLLAAAAYNRVFDVLANELADRCDFRGIPTLLPLAGPNLAHPSASPEGVDDNLGSDGWGGTGSAPDGGDLYQPYEQSKETNLRVLDRIGRERFAYIDMDFYLRNALLTSWETEVPKLRAHAENLVERYLRPFCSSECGWTASGNKDTATVNRTKLAGALDAIHNPVSGMLANLPVGYIVHYIPDGNNEGKDRYRLIKSLDNVGSGLDNPWETMSSIFPGRGTHNSAFAGQPD